MKIAIASGKGGTGKTTLSVNLAEFLAEKQKVILVDLDVEEPNSGIFITGDVILDELKYKLIPTWNKNSCTLCGQCQEFCSFNAIVKLEDSIMVFPQLCHTCYVCSDFCPTKSLPMQPQKIGKLKHISNKNIDFIESRLDIGEERAVPLISQTFEYIDNKFDNNTIKIIDSPPGAACPVVEVIKSVDFVILVTEPTPFGLHDLKIAVETVKGLNKKFAVVINRYGIGDNEVEKYCSNNDISIIAKIPNKRKIAELYSVGKLIYKEIPEVKTELEQIYKILLS